MIPNNVGKIDKIIRVVVGIIFIAIGWGIFRNNWLGLIFNVLGGIALLEAVMGKCYIYKLLNFSTNKPPASPFSSPSNPPPTTPQ